MRGVRGAELAGGDGAVRMLAEQLAVARLQTEVAMEIGPLVWLAMPDRNDWIAVVVEDATARWLRLDESTRARSELFGTNGFIAGYLATVERDVDGGQHGSGCGCADRVDEVGLFGPVWRNHACQATVWRRHVERLLADRPPAADPPAVAAGSPHAEVARRLRDELRVQQMRTAVTIQVAPYVEQALDRQRGWIAAVVADVVDGFDRRGPSDPQQLTGPRGFIDAYLGRVSWDRDRAGEEIPKMEFLDDHHRTDEDAYLRRVWQHHVRQLAGVR